MSRSIGDGCIHKSNHIDSKGSLSDAGRSCFHLARANILQFSQRRHFHASRARSYLAVGQGFLLWSAQHILTVSRIYLEWEDLRILQQTYTALPPSTSGKGCHHGVHRQETLNWRHSKGNFVCFLRSVGRSSDGFSIMVQPSGEDWETFGPRMMSNVTEQYPIQPSGPHPWLFIAEASVNGPNAWPYRSLPVGPRTVLSCPILSYAEVIID